MEYLAAAIAIVYILLNIYVTRKINKAYYLKEERRKLHKIFIWIIPFLGPLMIKSFWQEKKNETMEVMTKDKRKIDKSSYYESGSGMYP